MNLTDGGVGQIFSPWCSAAGGKGFRSMGSSGVGGKFAILSELVSFLMHRKKWWLAPILLLLVLLSLLIVLTEGSAVAPFIYTLF